MACSLRARGRTMRKPLPDLALLLWLAVLTAVALCAFVGFVYWLAGVL